MGSKITAMDKCIGYIMTVMKKTSGCSVSGYGRFCWSGNWKFPMNIIRLFVLQSSYGTFLNGLSAVVYL